jgi:hypothetical protein
VAATDFGGSACFARFRTTFDDRRLKFARTPSRPHHCNGQSALIADCPRLGRPDGYAPITAFAIIANAVIMREQNSHQEHSGGSGDRN